MGKLNKTIDLTKFLKNKIVQAIMNILLGISAGSLTLVLLDDKGYEFLNIVLPLLSFAIIEFAAFKFKLLKKLYGEGIGTVRLIISAILGTFTSYVFFRNMPNYVSNANELAIFTLLAIPAITAFLYWFYGKLVNYIKNTYLNNNSNIYYTIIPDKNYFVNKGNLKLDYNKLQDMMKNNLTNLNYINIFDKLTLNNYYKTDTHWKQEDLFNVANTIANQMNFDITNNNVENTITTFKGSYAGRLSVTKDIDTIKTISNPSIDNSSVYNYETKKYTKIYDYDKLKSLDKYDIYLSGASSIIDIVNPTSNSNKELIVFRDSYGSSLVPLLIDGYRKITVIDIRYVSSKILNNYIKFDNQDVLFMYSILTINNSFSMR